MSGSLSSKRPRFEEYSGGGSGGDDEEEDKRSFSPPSHHSRRPSPFHRQRWRQLQRPCSAAGSDNGRSHIWEILSRNPHGRHSYSLRRNGYGWEEEQEKEEEEEEQDCKPPYHCYREGGGGVGRESHWRRQSRRLSSPLKPGRYRGRGGGEQGFQLTENSPWRQRWRHEAEEEEGNRKDEEEKEEEGPSPRVSREKKMAWHLHEPLYSGFGYLRQGGEGRPDPSPRSRPSPRHGLRKGEEILSSSILPMAPVVPGVWDGDREFGHLCKAVEKGNGEENDDTTKECNRGAHLCGGIAMHSFPTYVADNGEWSAQLRNSSSMFSRGDLVEKEGIMHPTPPITTTLGVPNGWQGDVGGAQPRGMSGGVIGNCPLLGKAVALQEGAHVGGGQHCGIIKYAPVVVGKEGIVASWMMSGGRGAPEEGTQPCNMSGGMVGKEEGIMAQEGANRWGAQLHAIHGPNTNWTMRPLGNESDTVVLEGGQQPCNMFGGTVRKEGIAKLVQERANGWGGAQPHTMMMPGGGMVGKEEVANWTMHHHPLGTKCTNVALEGTGGWSPNGGIVGKEGILNWTMCTPLSTRSGNVVQEGPSGWSVYGNMVGEEGMTNWTMHPIDAKSGMVAQEASNGCGGVQSPHNMFGGMVRKEGVPQRKMQPLNSESGEAALESTNGWGAQPSGMIHGMAGKKGIANWTHQCKMGARVAQEDMNGERRGVHLDNALRVGKIRQEGDISGERIQAPSIFRGYYETLKGGNGIDGGERVAHPFNGTGSGVVQEGHQHTNNEDHHRQKCVMWSQACTLAWLYLNPSSSHQVL